MPESPDPKIRAHPFRSVPGAEAPRASRSIPYAELHVRSNFSFLTGASHPEELVEQAAHLGHAAAAITDINTLAGVVRAHVAAKQVGVALAIGAQLVFGLSPDPSGHAMGATQSFPATPISILAFPTDRPSYARLSQLLTRGKRRAPKGECHLFLDDLIEHQEGLLAVVIPPAALDDHFIELIGRLRGVFDNDRLSIAASRGFGHDDAERLAGIADICARTRVPMAATNAVLCHVPERRHLQDVLTCIRLGTTIDQAGTRLQANAERHLKTPEEMARLFAEYPQALARSAAIAGRAAAFSLDEIKYQYPDEVCPPGRTPMQHLRHLTWKGALERYSAPPEKRTWMEPGGAGAGPRDTSRALIPGDVVERLEHEFTLIEELNYAHYFLTVHDIVRFARERGILCQGRGAAANSAVCYCLGITAVDPSRIDLLFERFVSKERNEPPDIDIDFEHERREEVIQYIYAKYGRHRAALTAEVISYRSRSAVRDVGKALGLSLDTVDRLAKSLDWWDRGAVRTARLRELGLNPDDPTLRHVLRLTEELLGFPRHLSQHVGGFVITQDPLCDLVPIENAAMDDRTVIEWDKDDIDAMGFLKVDCLGLGMLTCIRRAFRFIDGWKGEGEGQRGKGAEGQREVERAFHEQNHEGANLPGPDRVATRQATGVGDLQNDGIDASARDIRFDEPNEEGLVIDPLEHCRGIRQVHASGVHEGTSDRNGIVVRALHSLRDRNRTQDAEGGSDRALSHPGSGSLAAGNSHETGSKDKGGGARTRTCQTPQDAEITPPFAPLPLCPSAPLQLTSIPPEDPRVYDMICRADTIGVFQIESRAQMSMLPRLKPRSFYDLVIEVAIVRPGPIQGDMVHPYLRRRNAEEPIDYPSDAVKGVLGRTLGVPLFQEQAMKLAIVAAGFSPGEADQLRRAMAAWKRKGDRLLLFHDRFVGGMLRNGYTAEFAERCFNQLKGFSEYGFPESHAASFALLVYVSAWLKCHHPAAFAAALINSQPMGFYAPAQIVRDAQEHGVEVRGVDVNTSAWDCSLEARRSGEATRPCGHPALRLGMRLVKGLRQDEAQRIADAVRLHGPFPTIDALHRVSGVRVATLRALAKADAFQSMGIDRQHALWQVRELRDEELPLLEQKWQSDAAPERQGEKEDAPALPYCRSAAEALPLPLIPAPTRTVHDYAATGLSLKPHPISFLRDRLNSRGVTLARALRDPAAAPAGRFLSVAGIVLVRQRPATASGVVFFTIEDETGIANLIVRPHIYERYRRNARHSVIITAHGKVERQGDVVHVLVSRIASLDDEMADLTAKSRDFH